MLMRTDPFREFDRLTRRVLDSADRSAVAAMDAYRKGDQFIVHFDLPGVRSDDIELTVERNVLTVKAERRGPQPDSDVEIVATERPQGSISRQLFLGDTLDTDNLEATYDTGVLTITIPVAEAAKPRQVQIATSEDRRQIVS